MRLSRRWRRERREWFTFIAFVAPNAILFLAFTYWPILYSLVLSFTDWDLLRPARNWVGVENYVELVRDGAFWRVTLNTLVYAAVVVLIAQFAAFFVALLLNLKLRGQHVFRTLAFLPHVTMTAAAALVWVLLLHPQYGPLGPLYSALGIPGKNWLESSSLALVALMSSVFGRK
jgi:ABC-type sugar transport system permease subunit